MYLENARGLAREGALQVRASVGPSGATRNLDVQRPAQTRASNFPRASSPTEDTNDGETARATAATKIHPALATPLTHLGTWEERVEARATRGGSSRKSVEDQIEELKKAFEAVRRLDG